jgi:hypothetical protein
MSRFKELNPQTEKYLIRMYCLYEEKKLTYREQVQLFQDLLDTGMVFKMGPEVMNFTQRLLNVKLIDSRKKVKENAN